MDEHKDVKGNEVKTDLRHDTMEFGIGDEPQPEKPQSALEAIEEEEAEVTAEELFNLEADDQQSQDKALELVEKDRLDDQDNLPEENWEEDLPDQPADTSEDDEFARK